MRTSTKRGPGRLPARKATSRISTAPGSRAVVSPHGRVSVTFDADADVLAVVDALAAARYPERPRTARSMMLRDILGMLRPGPANLEGALEDAHRALLGRAAAKPLAFVAVEEVARVVSPRLHQKLATARAREGA